MYPSPTLVLHPISKWGYAPGGPIQFLFEFIQTWSRYILLDVKFYVDSESR